MRYLITFVFCVVGVLGCPEVLKASDSSVFDLPVYWSQWLEKGALSKKKHKRTTGKVSLNRNTQAPMKPSKKPQSSKEQAVAGPRGPQGPQGPQGARGPAGAQGQKGSPGEQGPAGPRGPTGPSGATGVGVTGPTGERGATGATGERGETGATGSTGAAGATGERGATGEPGEKGLRGSRGAQGPQGLQGALGPQGAEGPMGPIGPQGPQGPIGPQGLQGPTGSGVPPVFGQITYAVAVDEVAVEEGSLPLQPQGPREGVGYNEDGYSFTIADSGSYVVEYFFQAWATPKTVVGPVVLELIVNGVPETTTRLAAVPTPYDGMHPYIFSGSRKLTKTLSAGDSVKLSIKEIPQGGIVYYVDGEDADVVASLFIQKVGILP